MGRSRYPRTHGPLTCMASIEWTQKEPLRLSTFQQRSSSAVAGLMFLLIQDFMLGIDMVRNFTNTLNIGYPLEKSPVGTLTSQGSLVHAR